MSTFLLGIITSLVASVVSLLVGWGVSSRAHWPVALLSRLTGLGLLRAYRTQKDANVDLPADLATARWIRVLAGRGNELTRDAFRRLWDEADARLEFAQILLPDPAGEPGSWFAAREAELLRFDSGHSPGLAADQVRANIEYLRTIASRRDRVELRLANLPVACRIIATDRLVYFTMYSAADHGRNSPCQVYRNPSPIYSYALHLFTLGWEQGRSG